MKKSLLAIILFATTIALAGCGSRNQRHDEVQPIDTDYIFLQDYDYIAHPMGDNYPPIDTDCIFLQDFDYMVQLMEDTFPYFGVAERRHGIDLREKLQESREFISGYPYSLIAKADSVDMAFLHELGFSIDLDNLPELDAHVFWELLLGSFFLRIITPEMLSIGHLGLFSSVEFDLYRTFYASGIAWHEMYSQYANIEETTLGDFALRAITSPTTVSFYQEFGESIRDDGFTPHIALTLLLMEYFSPGLAMELFSYDSIDSTHTFPESTPLHHTSTSSYAILEEDRIAYLRIPTFMPDIERALIEQATLLRFYQTIQNYDHLIIDIRGNHGGHISMWYAEILYALWPDMEDVPNMPLYAFYVDSELGRSFANDLWFDEYSFIIFEDDYVHASSLPYFNEADMLHFTQGTRINTNLGAHRRNPFIVRTPFAGEIWLLTCSFNYSSAEMFARTAKHMNFATLVGETTGGGHTNGRMFFALPNTGILVTWDIDYLTDTYGRSLEEFPTTPHYFNREGLCAFQTVMQMISERD